MSEAIEAVATAQEVLRGQAYVELWESLWSLPVEGEDRLYLESLSFRLRCLRAESVCAAMRHVAERFKARGHGRPTTRYLAGILSQRDYDAQEATTTTSQPGRRGTSMRHVGAVLNKPRVT